MNVLVIGGTRFMGPYLVQRLLEAGHRVTLFHREHCDAGAIHPAVPHVHGDRRHLPAHRGELVAVAPDVVVDMVCMTGDDARQLVEVFPGKRLVVASSMDVYLAYGRLIGAEPGDPLPGMLSEDAPVRTRWFLRRAEPPRAPDDPQRWMDDYEKLVVEPIVLEAGATVVRLPMVYGPGDFQHRVREYLALMDAGRRAIVLDERLAAWRTSRGYVENMAAALALAATHPAAAGRVYNVADRPATTEVAWVRAIGRSAGWRGEVVVVPGDRLPEALAAGDGFAQPWEVDDARIRTEFGYAQAVALDDALARTVAWERQHPLEASALAERIAAEDAVLATLGPRSSSGG